MSFLYFYLLLFAHPYLAQWHLLFPKLGRSKWEAFVPGYNYFVLFKVVLNKPWWSLLLLFPGVHLVMWMVINVSTLRRFGFYSFSETAQGLFFPYRLFHQLGHNESSTFGPETNWSNSREIEIRKWGDHLVLFLCLPVLGHVLAIGLDKISRDKPGEKPRVKEYGDSFVWALVAAAIIRTYSFEPFQIPTGSMEKTMVVGDFLFVNKLAYGPKVPITPLSYPLVHNIVPFVNIKSYLTWEKGSYTRLPGWAKIQRNDVVVFNFPSGDTAILDPRTPSGLMGHDFHGLLNQEAIALFMASHRYENLNAVDSTELEKFLANFETYKKQARIRFANGEFPIFSQEASQGMKHGGTIFRPVDKRENYIKRCVGTPGDRLEVINSILYVNGKPAYVSPGQALLYRIEKSKVNFPSAQEMLNRYALENSADGARTDFDSYSDPQYYILNLTRAEKRQIEADFKCKLSVVRYPHFVADNTHKVGTALQRLDNINQFPKDLNVYNTMTDFQAFRVPKKGQRIRLTLENLQWYKRIICAYEGHVLAVRDGLIFIDGKQTTSYRFAMNYYWMMGDNRFHSADSRVWGFVPEDHIVGRASFVWFSKSPFVDSFLGIRWERVFRFVH
ncbi:MAG: hypothetical protein RLZZ301_1347 [Bacteroidota bacterium]|jgi:signal peptidase I